MRQSRIPRPFLVLAVPAVLLVCCRTAPQAHPAPAEAAPEASVRPGINERYRDAPVDVWVERFERPGREIYDRRREIVAACGVGPGEEVADVGAGTGLFVEILSAAAGPQGTVYAVDIVPEFVARIAGRAASAGLANVRAVLCTERSVELPPGSIDLALVCDTYHHFEYPRSTMTSIREALRPGGVLVVVDLERIEGVSSDWALDHVRAGREAVVAEIESFGFKLQEEVRGLLRENYFLRFRRP